MKANELMIGDWVYLKHTEDGIPPYDEPIQWQRDDYDYTDVFVETHINPIPITPEILEKNGFDSDNNAFGHQDYSLFDDFFLENRGNRFCVSRKLSKFGSSFFIMEIRYVHELQLFLLLCGIKKEITI